MEAKTPPVEANARFLTWLETLDLPKTAIGEGDRAPDFMLPSADGELVELGDVLARGPVVLSFLRGGWCDFCIGEMAGLVAINQAVEGTGAHTLAIVPETGDYVQAFKEALEAPFPMLCDLDLGVATTYGLVFRLPEEMRSIFGELGFDLPGRQGHGGWMLPVPATYVLDPDGLVRAAHVDPDYRVRMQPDAILDALNRLVS